MAKSSAISSPCSRAAATSRAKSSKVPSSGWMASWPPSSRADRVGAAGIVRPGRQAVVLALAVRAADRVDRREVEHVEAEVAHIGQLARSRRRRCRAGSDRRDMRARHQLVPGAEGGAPCGRRRAPARARSATGWCGCRRASSARRSPAPSAARAGSPSSAVASSCGEQRCSACAVRVARRARSRASVVSTRSRPSVSSSAIGTPAACFFDTSSRQLAKRSRQAIDRVDDSGRSPRPAAKPRQRSLSKKRHRRFAPVVSSGAADQERGVDLVVAVGEDVGLDGEAVADRRLGREAAAVDLGRDVLDDDAIGGEPRRARGSGSADCARPPAAALAGSASAVARAAAAPSL